MRGGEAVCLRLPDKTGILAGEKFRGGWEKAGVIQELLEGLAASSSFLTGYGRGVVVSRPGSARVSRRNCGTGELISQLVARHSGVAWNPIECIGGVGV